MSVPTRSGRVQAILQDRRAAPAPRLRRGHPGRCCAPLAPGGHDIRVGLENILVLPDAGRAASNAELVAAAAAL